MKTQSKGERLAKMTISPRQAGFLRRIAGEKKLFGGELLDWLEFNLGIKVADLEQIQVWEMDRVVQALENI